jgi:transcriptional regulator with XRE-family HTH domain
MAARTNHSNGDAIRAIRTRTGLSIKQTADLLREHGVEVHPDHLSNVELGHKGASDSLLKALSEVLQVPIVAITSMRDAA